MEWIENKRQRRGTGWPCQTFRPVYARLPTW
jgi:hypothetical protein